MKNEAVRNSPCEWIQNAATRLIKSESTIKAVKVASFLAISTYSFTLACTSLVLYRSYKGGSYAYGAYCKELAEARTNREKELKELAEARIKSAVEADQAADLEEAIQALESERKKAIQNLTNQGLKENIAFVNDVFGQIRNHPDFRANGKDGKWVGARIKEYVSRYNSLRCRPFS